MSTKNNNNSMLVCYSLPDLLSAPTPIGRNPLAVGITICITIVATHQ